MTAPEEWAQGEIVRNITDLTKEVRRLGEKIEGLGDKFVTRETFTLTLDNAMNKMVSKRAVAAWVVGAAGVASAVGALIEAGIR